MALTLPAWQGLSGMPEIVIRSDQCIGEGLLSASRLAVGQALWPFATAALRQPACHHLNRYSRMRPLRPLAACRENRPFLSP